MISTKISCKGAWSLTLSQTDSVIPYIELLVVSNLDTNSEHLKPAHVSTLLLDYFKPQSKHQHWMCNVSGVSTFPLHSSAVPDTVITGVTGLYVL